MMTLLVAWILHTACASWKALNIFSKKTKSSDIESFLQNSNWHSGNSDCTFLIYIRGRSQTTFTRFCLFLTIYPPAFTFSMVWKFTKSGRFWTTYLPRLVNVVCERPLIVLRLHKTPFIIFRNKWAISIGTKDVGRFLFPSAKFTLLIAKAFYWL